MDRTGASQEAPVLFWSTAVHAFPPRPELDFLLSDDPELTQIIVNPYGLHLVFDNACSIGCEYALTHVTPDGRQWRYEGAWREQTGFLLHNVLEDKLVAIEREDWSLTLRFSAGASIVVHSQLGAYESGHLARRDGVFIVF
jgi:hypothetical protein